MTQPSARVFLDQNNIFFRFKKLDFKSLLAQLKKEFEIIKATSYMAVDTRQEAQRKFIIYMSNNGWRCNTVDISENTNIDNTLTADMINDHINTPSDWVILISGDGDYSYPLHMLSTKGAKIMVIGAKDNISLELLKVADRIKYIEEFDSVIRTEYDNPRIGDTCMEVISSVDLVRCDTESLKAILSGDNRIQLKIDSKSEFDDLMKSQKSNLIYEYSSRIVSLRGPIKSSPCSSVFEDTALIVSFLEDNLEVSLQYVTTLPNGDGKHIVELSEFFQDTISIFASTLPFVTKSQFRTPYGIYEHLKGIYCDRPGYDKMAYMGMSYNVFDLNPVWLGAEVCYSIMDMIDEIYICQPAGKTFSLPILLWLAEMKAMGSNAYIVLDTSNMELNSWLTIEKMIQEV